MSKKIVIVGNGPAGLTAASAARIADRTAEITVVDTKDYDTYHPCAMPFVIGKYLPSIDNIIEDLNYGMLKVTLHKSSIVDNVDTDAKKVFVKNIKTKEETTLEYDNLVLCIGSYVFVPPIPGKDLGNIFTLKFAEDAEAIKQAALKKGVEKVTVVGGSAIGIEVASELCHLGKEVTIIEMLPQLMPFRISKNFANIVEKKLAETGVIIKTEMMVKEIIGDKKVKQITYGKDDLVETIDADLVVLATGVRPQIDLATKIGIKTHEKLRAIKVNEKMETNIPGIYAAGDCVTVKNIVTNEDSLAMFAGPAARQARVAGTNAAGGNLTYPGTVIAYIVSSRTFYFGAVGISEEQAKNLDINIVTGKVTAPIRPHYMPDSKEITLKLIANADDGKLLGAEVVGEEKVDVNINYVAMALQAGFTVYDIMNTDFCYAPAVSETIYPIVKSADSIVRKIERKKAKANK
jgi:NADH oxidase (H2O2-forming)